MTMSKHVYDFDMLTLFVMQALAYVMHKTPNVFPIVGQRSVKHLEGNVDALKIDLTDADLEEIEGAAPFDAGFPMNFIFRDNYNLRNTAADVWLTKSAQLIDTPPKQSAVKARKE